MNMPGLEEFVGRMMGQLYEDQRRLFLGGLAELLGRGGATYLCNLTDVSRVTISKGQKEFRNLKCDPKAPPRTSDVRQDTTEKESSGRKTIEEKFPGLTMRLARKLCSKDMESPEKPLCWTVLSTRVLSDELQAYEKTPVSPNTVSTLLRKLGFEIQPSRSSGQQALEPEEINRQLETVNDQARSFRENSDPVIYVAVRHKAPAQNLTDGTRNFVRSSISESRSVAAVDALRQWWNEIGRKLYPKANRLMIVAQFSDSEDAQNVRWEQELRNFASEIQLPLHVHNFPPATIRWNTIGHYTTIVGQEQLKDGTCRTLEIRICNIAPEENLVLAESTATQEEISASNTGLTRIQRDTQKAQWNFVIYPPSKG